MALAACGDEQPSPGPAASERGTLYYYRGAAHKTLDPAKQFDQASAEIIMNVYDTLLEYHYLERPYRLVPGLLAKLPELLDDGVTYRFTLRKDVRFIDDPAFAGGKGRELVADDVIYSIKRFADSKVNVKSYILIQGFVDGLDEFRDKTKQLGGPTDYDSLDVAGIRKVDDHTLTIRFTRKNPLALYPFATTPMSIVAREAVEHYGEDFGNHPVGTGPFYIKEYSRRGKMVLKRNPNYHGVYPSSGAAGDRERGLLADAGKALPLLDEVHLPLIEESQPAMLNFKSGQLDWVGMNKDDFANIAYRDADGEFHLRNEFTEQFNMYAEPGLSAEYLVFNLSDPVLGKNKALRQAIAYALDTPAYVKLLLNDRALPLRTIVPQPIAGSERDIEARYFSKDLSLARQKLAEAGYPGGDGLAPITIEIRNANKEARDGFEFIRAELAEIGIILKSNFQTFSAYLKRVESGNFQMTGSGWGADYPDAENFYQLLYGPNRTPGPNMSNFAHAQYDELFERSRFMDNGPERFALFARMSSIIHDEVPIILRYNGIRFGLHQKTLRNLKRNIMIDAPYKFLAKQSPP